MNLRPKSALACCLMLFLVACGSKKDKQLLSFNEGFFDEPNEDAAQRDFLTQIVQHRHKDTLTIDVKFQAAGCMAFDGDIHTSLDSLFLKYWQSNDEVCTEISIYHMQYETVVKKNLSFPG